jgi:dTDP-4-amino-4,6-dideoxygalactose transaminase
MNPFQVVRDFERALCEYTGAPYAVTTTSCTMALLLAVAWHLRRIGAHHTVERHSGKVEIEIPKRTYVGVAWSIINAGGRPTFRDEDWRGRYQLKPLPVWDSARLFTGGMYRSYAHERYLDEPFANTMQCVSFHWSKTLGIQQGGAILHDDIAADAWLRRARFDGRTESVLAAEDKIEHQGLAMHAYMAPETAAAGLVRLANLPKHNEPLPNDPYPDLSQLEVFR